MPYSLHFLPSNVTLKVKQSDNQSSMHAYMAALFLPHTDLSLFPSAIATEASDRFKPIPQRCF